MTTAAKRARKKASRQRRHEHVPGERCLICRPLPLTAEQRAARAFRRAQAAAPLLHPPLTGIEQTDKITRQITALLTAGRRQAQVSGVTPFTRKRGARNT